METRSTVFPLAAGIQSYDWGKFGSTSKAAQYASRGSIPGFEVDESKPYAELWMGTHPTLPSCLLGSDETLSAHLAIHSELMGPKVCQRFTETKEGHLPFLFKILAIRKALSIQAHPDKELAKKLHAERPDLYKDANHKPEMAIALTPFTALCGFRPLPQISTYLAHVPEFAALIPSAILSAFQTASSSASSDATVKGLLCDLFSAAMTAPPDLVQTQVRLLVGRYKSGGHDLEEADVCALAVELDSQFPNDIGVFCVFLLNVVRLKPGEAIFLGAGEPHAYLAGDIIETMATSDNVLRAGLTPKMRDVPNLLVALTYHTGNASAHTVASTPFSHGSTHTKLYDPPIPEFSVLHMSLSHGEHETHRTLEGPSLLVVTQGTGQIEWAGNESLAIKEGTVLFVGSGTPVAFRADEKLVLYRAFVEAQDVK